MVWLFISYSQYEEINWLLNQTKFLMAASIHTNWFFSCSVLTNELPEGIFVTERMGIWFLRGFATGLISVLYEDYMVNIVLHGYLAKVPLQFVMHVQWFSHVGSCRIVIRGYRHKPVSDVTAIILFSPRCHYVSGQVTN